MRCFWLLFLHVGSFCCVFSLCGLLHYVWAFVAAFLSMWGAFLGLSPSTKISVGAHVCINDDYSRSHTSSCGVPQGSVLSARMFTMYMRPLSAIMNKHGVSYHSYADDIQLYLKCGNNDISVDDTISRLEMCIRDICMVWYGNILFDIVHNIIENILTKHKNI